MSVVVAIEAPGGVHLACDSAIVTGDAVDICRSPKWWRAGSGLVVAACGDVAAVRVLRARLRVPARISGADVDEWAETELGKAVQSATERTRSSDDDREYEASEPELQVLIAAHGGVYLSGPGGDVHRSAHGFAAIGSGADVAIGAIEVLRNAPKAKGDALAKVAVRASEKHTASVRLPVHYLWVPA